MAFTRGSDYRDGFDWIGGWLWEVILPYTFQFLVIVNFSNIVITIVHIFQCNKLTFHSQDIQPFLWLIWYIHCNIIAATKLAEVFSILPVFDCKCSVTILLHRKNVQMHEKIKKKLNWYNLWTGSCLLKLSNFLFVVYPSRPLVRQTGLKP